MNTTFEGFDPRLNLQGFTSLPNAFFDKVLPKIESLAELKVLLATFRKTYGWIDFIDKDTGQAVYKQEDAISYSQYEKITGLSSPSISSGLSKAIEDGYMVRTEEGTYQGKSAVYRVKLKGEGPPPDIDDKEPIPEPPEPDWKTDILPKITLDTDRDKETNGFLTKDVENDKESMIGDFFGQGQAEEAPKAKKEKSTWKAKDKSKWNCNDLLSYYRDMYQMTYNIHFGHITGKERANAKALCDSYGAEAVSKVVDYAFKQGSSLPYLPKEPLNFSIFYGWFKRLYGEMTGTQTTQTKTREFNEQKHLGREDVLGW